MRRTVSFGPGLLFLLSAVGPADLITNSVAGATEGYRLLWLLVVAVTARFLILEATARYVIAAGESIVVGCRRVGKWMVWLVFIAPMAKRHLAGLSQLLLLGAAAHVVFPLPTRHSIAIWSLLSWAAAFTLVFWGRYHLVERFSRWMAVLLGGSLAAAALLARPQPVEILRGTLIPSLPDATGLYGSAMVIMAVLGGAAGNLSNFKYAAFVHEKGWRDISHLRRQRTDLLFSITAMFVMLAAIQVAGAGALRPAGVRLERVEDLIPIFTLVLGDAGRIVLAASLWSVVFNNHVASATGYSLMLADIYHRYIRPSGVIAEQDSGRGAAYLPSYRWFLLYFFIAPLYVFLTDWTPIWLVMVNAAAGIVLLPVTVLVLLRLTADRRHLGRHANNWLTNALLGITLVAALYLAYQGVAELAAGA